MWTEEEMKESYRETYEEMNRFDSLEEYLKFLEEEKNNANCKMQNGKTELKI